MFALFLLRFLVGMAESPSFPANTRIVAAWFPAAERGTASAIFNSGQYFATVLFAPIMGESLVRHAVRKMPQFSDKRKLFRREPRKTESVVD